MTDYKELVKRLRDLAAMYRLDLSSRSGVIEQAADVIEKLAPKATRNRASAKKAGASFEGLVARYLAARLNDDRIERRAKTGAKDRGDIAGVRTIRGGRVVIECKNTSRDALPAWIAEAEIERGNDDAVVGVVAHKKRGAANPAEQYVSMTLETFCRLLEGGGDDGPVVVADPMTVEVAA